VKANKRTSLIFCVATIVTMSVAFPGRLSGQAAVLKSTGGNDAVPVRWSVQVDKIDPGELDLAYSFQVAIYESLLEELNKTKQFQQVFRDGDHRANAVPKLLLLKTTVEAYAPGSETLRAVTTVSGATKLMVRSQLCTREGKVVLERTVNGNVRFFGSNLRATHNLASNIARTIKQSSWSESELPVAILTGQLWSREAFPALD